MHTDRHYFSLDSIASNPNFDFINSFTNEQADPDDPPNFAPNSPYEISNFYCTYVDPLAYSNTYKNTDKFSIMSLNIQSLHAKFSELKDLIITLSSNHCAPDIICIQELWQFPSITNFSLPGYGPLIYKLRGNNIQGGGGGLEYFSKAPLNLKFLTTFQSLWTEFSNQSL